MRIYLTILGIIRRERDGSDDEFAKIKDSFKNWHGDRETGVNVEGDHGLAIGEDDEESDDCVENVGKKKKKDKGAPKKKLKIEDKETPSDEELKKELGLESSDEENSDGEDAKLLEKAKATLRSTNKLSLKLQETIANTNTKDGAIQAAAKIACKSKKSEFDASMKDLGKVVFAKNKDFDKIKEQLQSHIELENEVVELCKKKKLFSDDGAKSKKDKKGGADEADGKKHKKDKKHKKSKKDKKKSDSD